MKAGHLEATATEVAGKLDAYRVIDVREESEYRGPLGHIVGAENVPMAALEACASSLGGGAPLLFVCRSGKRSARACDALAGFGVPGATNLLGGMIGWNRSGLPRQRQPFASAAAILEALAIWLSQVRQVSRAEADARVDASLVAVRGAPGRTTGAIVVRSISWLEDELRGSGDPPADLDLVCAALRADAKALAAVEG